MTQSLAPITQDVAFKTWRWQDKTAKLSLKFNDNVLQEVVLSGGVVTIGRQPDNLIRIDNPIVSGHHARIFWENNHYVLEDNESFNATYLNNRRVSRAALNDGDVIVIGKHRIEFHSSAGKRDVSSTSASQDRTTVWQAHVEKAAPPPLEATMVLDGGGRGRCARAAGGHRAGAGLRTHGGERETNRQGDHRRRANRAAGVRSFEQAHLDWQIEDGQHSAEAMVCSARRRLDSPAGRRIFPGAGSKEHPD